jgi:hypothetical protein
MEFTIQHNGVGKHHLLDENLEVLCKNKGDFNFTAYHTIIFRDGKFFEKNREETELKDCLLESEYCKKCINYARQHH